MEVLEGETVFIVKFSYCNVFSGRLSSNAVFSREKVALDESGTTKQNQFVQKNHVVNDNRSTLFNDINDHNDAATMMATPKTGGRRTSRKLKRENLLGAKGKPSEETAPNNNESLQVY